MGADAGARGVLKRLAAAPAGKAVVIDAAMIPALAQHEAATRNQQVRLVTRRIRARWRCC
jgi:hypothetical protein